jgi:hypothetical protein
MRSEFACFQSLQQAAKVEVCDCLDFRLILQARTVIHMVHARDSMLNVDQVWSYKFISDSTFLGDDLLPWLLDGSHGEVLDIVSIFIGEF